MATSAVRKRQKSQFSTLNHTVEVRCRRYLKGSLSTQFLPRAVGKPIGVQDHILHRQSARIIP
jgi:hypothetical protein